MNTKNWILFIAIALVVIVTGIALRESSVGASVISFPSFLNQ